MFTEMYLAHFQKTHKLSIVGYAKKKAFSPNPNWEMPKNKIV